MLYVIRFQFTSHPAQNINQTLKLTAKMNLSK